MQAGFHLPPPITAGKFFRRPTNQGRDQRADAALVPTIHMRSLRIVTGIRGQRLQMHNLPGLVQGLPKMQDIGPRPLPGHNRQHHVARAVAKDAGLGERAVGGFLPVFAGAGSTLHVVPAGMMRLESRAVQRSHDNALAKTTQSDTDVNGPVEGSSSELRNQQSRGRLLKGGVVGHALQINRRTPFRAIGQHSRQLPVVQPQELFQHQASE